MFCSDQSGVLRYTLNGTGCAVPAVGATTGGSAALQ